MRFSELAEDGMPPPMSPMSPGGCPCGGQSCGWPCGMDEGIAKTQDEIMAPQVRHLGGPFAACGWHWGVEASRRGGKMRG